MQELLVGALLLHPLVLPRLIGKLQEKGAAKVRERGGLVSEWGLI